MSNSVGRGAFVLIVSGIICKIFGGLFRLPLTNIIGIEGIGIFQMIMSIYSLALVFVSGGVTNALSKLVSSARARGDGRVIGAYLRYGLIFTMSLSFAFAIFFLLFSKPIASAQGIASGQASYKLLAFILPLGGLVGVARGLLQGYENMTPTALSQIIEQVSKFAFGLIFAYILSGGGIEKGVFGAFLGIGVSEVLACIYLAYSALHKKSYHFGKEGGKEFFSASLPLTFGGAVFPLTHAVEAMFIISLLVKSGLSSEQSTMLYGLQTGVVGAILNFPLIISVSVAVTLLPNIAFLASRGDKKGEQELIAKSFSSMLYLLFPLVGGIMAISRGLYPIIYPSAIEGYLEMAVQLTYISGISIVLTAIMQLLQSILQANGGFTQSLIFSVLGGVGKLALLFITAPLKEINIFSIAISNIVLALIVSICALIWLKDLVKMPAFDLLLPLLSTVIMFLVVKIFLSLVGGILGLLLAVIIGMAVYFTMTLPLTMKYINLILNNLKTRAQ